MSLKEILSETKNIITWRTRNILIDPFYILRWDLIPRLRRRDNCENAGKMPSGIKIPVTIITYNRPWYFERTLESFIEMNRSYLKRLILIVLIQGDKDEATDKIINKFKRQIHNVIYPGENLGVAGGYNLIMAESLKLQQPYIVHLQDDFFSNEPLSGYIPELIEVMETNQKLGFIRLRSIKDKVNDYNVISRRKIKYAGKIKNTFIGNGHFTFNPTLTRSSVIKEIVPTTSEKDAQQKYQQLGLKTGQLSASCFTHIGDERVRDWMK
jgi:GT2 family glycosyltransferase